jgi:hypothetical protein
LVNFKNLINQKVAEYRKQATDSYKLAYDKSIELEINNEWSEMAHDALANLDPVNYQKSDEIIMDAKQAAWSF